MGEGTLVRRSEAPDSEQVVVLDSQAAQTAQELLTARRQGIFGLLRLRFEAWLEDRMKESVIQKLKTRQELVEAQQKTTEAEIKLHALVQTGQRDLERHKTEFNQARWQRLQSDLEHSGIVLAAPAGGNGPTAAAPVSVHISDEQIEALSLRAVMQLGQEEASEAEWEEYRAELHRRLPPYAAAEVERRIRELRELAPEARP